MESVDWPEPIKVLAVAIHLQEGMLQRQVCIHDKKVFGILTRFKKRLFGYVIMSKFLIIFFIYHNRYFILIGPWVSKNEKGEVILAGVHNSGDCDIDELPHVAVKVSFPPYLTWIKKVIGINN